MSKATRIHNARAAVIKALAAVRAAAPDTLEYRNAYIAFAIANEALTNAEKGKK